MARPGRPRSTPRANSPAPTSRTTPRNQSRSSAPNGTPAITRGSGVSVKANPNSSIGGTGRPLWPPVTGVALDITKWPMKISARVAMPR